MHDLANTAIDRKGFLGLNKMTLDQIDEEPLTYEVSDEALELATCTEREKANAFTQWICTAIYFCPGP
jgi:hypothetical protein